MNGEKMSNNIENKVVLITGASSGIGQATAELVAEKGAKIVLAARRENRLQELADKIKKAGGQAIYQVTDVTNPEDNKKLVQYAKENFGKIDAIFLNAGMGEAFLVIGCIGIACRGNKSPFPSRALNDIGIL